MKLSNILAGVSCAVCLAMPGLAQNISLDGTLGPAATLQGPIYQIDPRLGTAIDANLFHSFSQFNLSTGEIAVFGSDANIRNILGRVTGGLSSSIGGTLLTSSQTVNLFLINPNGIIFGPNASLGIGSSTRGSFFATTVDSVTWPDGNRFDAINPQGTSSLLNIVGDPSGFIASQRPIGDIQVNRSFLSVPSNQTLLLLGNGIDVDNSFLGIDGFLTGNINGEIQIISIAEAGFLPLSSEGNRLTVNRKHSSN